MASIELERRNRTRGPHACVYSLLLSMARQLSMRDTLLAMGVTCRYLLGHALRCQLLTCAALLPFLLLACFGSAFERSNQLLGLRPGLALAAATGGCPAGGLRFRCLDDFHTLSIGMVGGPAHYLW